MKFLNFILVCALIFLATTMSMKVSSREEIDTESDASYEYDSNLDNTFTLAEMDMESGEEVNSKLEKKRICGYDCSTSCVPRYCS